MILAAGLTPAWQQILLFDEFHSGQVNRAREVHWCSSGKVLNVAIALTHLGAASETAALVGGPHLARIDGEIEQLRIRRHWVESQSATRVCTTILDRKSGVTTELVENAGPATAGELSRFAEVYAEAAARAQIAILTGSLPAGAASDYYRTLLSRTNCPAILDVRGPELLAALDGRPLVVKPNREELAKTFGESLTRDSDLHRAMRRLNEAGAQWVVVTEGASGVWASSGAGLFRFDVASVDVVNPIGSGDCLAAGIAWGLSMDRDMLDSIRLGIAAAEQNVGKLLPCRLEPDRILQRSGSISVRKL